MAHARTAAPAARPALSANKPPNPTAATRKPPAAAVVSKTSSETKRYWTPSFSPRRGRRVVIETDGRMSGRRASTAEAIVVFPAPEGPDITRSFGVLLDPEDVERARAIAR